MKSVTMGFTLSLLGGVALAQTPPQLAVPPTARPPATDPAAQPAPPSTAMGQAIQNGAPGRDAAASQSGQPEGELIETPDGLYLVQPGQRGAQRLDMGRQPRKAERQATGRGGPDGMAESDDPMGDGAEDGAQPMPPLGARRPPPPRPPEGKGARLRIRTPNLNIGVKCPDEEPIKACIDAVSQLLDKANAQGH